MKTWCFCSCLCVFLPHTQPLVSPAWVFGGPCGCSGAASWEAPAARGSGSGPGSVAVCTLRRQEGGAGDSATSPKRRTGGLSLVKRFLAFALTDFPGSPGSEDRNFPVPVFQLRSPERGKELPRVIQLVHGGGVEPGSLSLAAAPCQGCTWVSPEDATFCGVRGQEGRAGGQVPGVRRERHEASASKP